MDELWGERPPASAVSALHVHLSKLRALLGDLIVSEPAGYALDRERTELDAWRFDALVDEARRDQARARGLLGEALALCRGDPLCDVACEGSVAQWRRALEEKQLQATLQRVDADLAAGASGELVAELTALAGKHPFEERLLGQLMLALYRSGRQADALDAFRRSQRLFAQELGLGLGEPLARLQSEILAGDPALIVIPDSRPSFAARPVSNLPRPPTGLVGRDRELLELAGLVADPDSRIVTLTGLGGVGKSRLLLELARSQEPDYRDGAVFVGLEQLRDSALVGAAIAAALAQRDRAKGLDADGLARYLREREVLLVLDNFEHLLAAAAMVADLVALAPRIRVLISSRTALQVRGEQVFEVGPLALPADETEHEVGQSPAVQLFLRCALAADRRLHVDAPLSRTVAGICRALDGLPLAIELVASRTRSLSPAQIALQLGQPLLLAQHSLRDLPERQQTLETALQWSYDLLSTSAQGVFRGAGTFVGGFTLAALEAVTGRPPQADLEELDGASLVIRQMEADRFALLGLVRSFAVAKLDASGEAAEARARHRRYFCAHVAPPVSPSGGASPPLGPATFLRPDHANFCAAIEDAIDAGDLPAALQLALGLRPLWHADMLRQEAHELIGRLLARFTVPPEQELALLRAASYLDHVDSGSVGNVAFTRRLAARAAELGDRAAQAIATGNLLGDAINAGDTEEISRLKPTLIELAASDLDDQSLAWIQYNLALAAYADGELDRACAHASRSAQLCGNDELTLAVATAMGLLAQSAVDGTIPQRELARTVELMRRPAIKTLSAFALWFVGRYAATVAPDLAARWLAYGEQIVTDLDAQLWPESVLRDETIAVLAITDLAGLIDGTPRVDHVAALAEAAAWLSARDPGEVVSRAPVWGPHTPRHSRLRPPLPSGSPSA